MAFELTQLRTLRTILLSTAVLSGCAVGGDDAAEPSTVLGHEEGAPHAHPVDAGTPIVVADAGSVPAPANCLPNTYDQIQVTIFDAPKYGCAQAFCHGDPQGHIDLRPGHSYDSLLGLAHADDDHAHADGDAHADESAPHTHAPGEEHPTVLHHEVGAHEEGEPDAHSHTAHVIPGNAEASVLYDRLRAKVQGTQPLMGGLPMPLGPTPITKGELKAVALWIEAGAPRTGFVPGTEGVCPAPAVDAGR